MLKLTKAGLCRLKFNKIYHICNFAVIFFILLNLYSDWTSYSKITNFPVSTFSRHLFDGINRIVISAATFISLYLGADYKNGTLRNKLAIGHNRVSVYVSNFIVCFIALVLTLILSTATVFAFGKLFMPPEFFPVVSEIIPRVLVCIPIMAAIAGINVLLAMLINSASISAAAAILASFIMICFSMVIHTDLLQPEYVTKAELEELTPTTYYTGEETDDIDEIVENPYYITGTKRKIYSFLDKIMPSSQILTMSDKPTNKDMGNIALLDMASVIVICAAGCMIFRRKDLK